MYKYIYLSIFSPSISNHQKWENGKMGIFLFPFPNGPCGGLSRNMKSRQRKSLQRLLQKIVNRNVCPL